MKLLINNKELSPIALPLENKIIQEKNKKIIHTVGKTAKRTYISTTATKLFLGVGLIGFDDGFIEIIEIFQDFSFYIGLAYATWGVIEYILDKPSGHEKIKKAIYGYIGVNILPIVFAAIKKAFSGKTRGILQQSMDILNKIPM